MNCQNCKHWVFGKCMITGDYITADKLCNGWELSVSFDQAQKSNSTPEDVTELKALVIKLVEAAEPFITFRKIQTNNRPDVWDVQLLEKHLSNWDDLVSIVKANKREEG